MAILRLRAEMVQKAKKTYLTSLIVILSIINQNCAHVSEPIMETYKFSGTGFKAIDPSSLPTDGVWASWDEALTIANNNKIERAQYSNEIAGLRKNNEYLSKKLNESEENNRINNTGYRAWLSSWGLPLGLLCGVGVGLGLGLGLKDKK